MAEETQTPPAAPPPGGPPAGGDDQPYFHVEKIYLKDFSFENPNTPEVYQITKEPRVNFNLNSNAAKKGEDVYEVTLHVTAEVKLEEKTMFLVDVVYAGLFLLRNLPAEHVPILLGVDCPNILFPYVRQLVSSMVTEGGFKPLLLDPINFAALYQQARAKAQTEKQGQAPTAPSTTLPQ